jgi:hypothetical protein
MPPVPGSVAAGLCKASFLGPTCGRDRKPAMLVIICKLGQPNIRDLAFPHYVFRTYNPPHEVSGLRQHRAGL